MAAAIICFNALISVLCAALFLRSWLQKRSAILVWCAICFLGLAADNLLLFVDLVLVPEISVAPWRSMASLLGVLCLLYGFILEVEA